MPPNRYARKPTPSAPTNEPNICVYLRSSAVKISISWAEARFPPLFIGAINLTETAVVGWVERSETQHQSLQRWVSRYAPLVVGWVERSETQHQSLQRWVLRYAPLAQHLHLKWNCYIRMNQPDMI